MSRETNLDAIKELLINFLYLDIRKTELSPLIVSHPIFSSGTIFYKGHLFDLFNSDDLSEILKYYAERFYRIATVEQCFSNLRSLYYLTFLKYIEPYLSLKDFSYYLAFAWIAEEDPNNDVNVSTDLAVKWFKSSDKQSLMTAKEYVRYSGLPKHLTLYRGISKDRNPDGLSWTESYEKALWFANRFGKGYVLTGDANSADVLAYFNRRDEDEIVISPKSINDIRIVENQ